MSEANKKLVTELIENLSGGRLEKGVRRGRGPMQPGGWRVRLHPTPSSSTEIYVRIRKPFSRPGLS